MCNFGPYKDKLRNLYDLYFINNYQQAKFCSLNQEDMYNLLEQNIDGKYLEIIRYKDYKSYSLKSIIIPIIGILF